MCIMFVVIPYQMPIRYIYICNMIRQYTFLFSMINKQRTRIIICKLWPRSPIPSSHTLHSAHDNKHICFNFSDVANEPERISIRYSGERIHLFSIHHGTMIHVPRTTQYYYCQWITALLLTSKVPVSTYIYCFWFCIARLHSLNNDVCSAVCSKCEKRTNE